MTNVTFVQFCTCAIIYPSVYYNAVPVKNDGLRQRKRDETRKELEVAAIDLVVRGSLEQTTIESISERANVSPRTFFNYFDSKEDALLGFHNIEDGEELIDTYTQRYSGDNTAASIVSLLIGLIGPSLADRELYVSRRKIIKRYPQLLERQINRIAHVSKQIIEVIKRAALDSSGLVIDDGEAEILLALCSSSVRIAVRDWAASGQKVSLPKLEQQSIKKLKEVLKKI